MCDCPSSEDLVGLLGDTLAEPLREVLEAHLGECIRCQEAFDKVAGARPDSWGRWRGLLRETNCQMPLSPGGLPTVPGYEILAELGRGGMGVVYRARQVALKRDVALKMILAERALPQAETRARFRTEAEAVARLQHPNIVPIHEVGEHGGLPYFTLEYIEGPTLKQHAAGAPIPPREAARIVEALARAMHYAHTQGIVHRDLKPANVLLSRGTGEPPVSSPLTGSPPEDIWRRTRKRGDASPQAAEDTGGPPVPRITDFGLAKQLSEKQGQTQTGNVMGTPSYIAPEQARGDKDIGPLVDVYALGAILYECLTGRPPFQGGTPMETLAAVGRDEPVPPRRLRPSLPRDLDIVALKCLEKDPARRYPSALALADDLRRFLEGRPMVARPASLTRRLTLWARRHPALAMLAAVSLAALTVLLLTWLKFTRDLRDQRDEARRQQRQALDNLREAREAAMEFFRLVNHDPDLAFQGNHALRLKLMQRALALQEKLSERYADDPELQAELGLSYTELGQLSHSLGDAEMAVRFLGRGVELGEAQLKREPDDPVLAAQLAIRRSSLAVNLALLDRFDEAEDAFRRAIALIEPVARKEGNPQQWWQLGSIQHNHAAQLQKRGRHQDAVAQCEAAIGSLKEANRLRERLGGTIPDYRIRLARAHLTLSALHAEVSEWPQADAHRDAALPHIEGALARHPRHVVYLDTRANHLALAARHDAARGRSEARGGYRKAIEAREKVVADHPRIARYRADLARLRVEWAELHRKDDPGSSADAYRAALSLYAELCKDAPKTWGYARDLAKSALALERLLVEGEAHLGQGIACLAPWLAEGNLEARTLAAELHQARGQRRQLAGEGDSAQEEFRRAAALGGK